MKKAAISMDDLLNSLQKAQRGGYEAEGALNLAETLGKGDSPAVQQIAGKKKEVDTLAQEIRQIILQRHGRSRAGMLGAGVAALGAIPAYKAYEHFKEGSAEVEKTTVNDYCKTRLLHGQRDRTIQKEARAEMSFGNLLHMFTKLGEDKVEKVMGEYKRGTLNSSSGDKVTDRKQAIAIALSEKERNA